MRRADILSLHGVTSVEGRSCRGNLQQAQQQERLCASDDSTREIVSLAEKAGHRNEERRSRKPTR
jgi:hypothetical protein